MLHPLAVLGIIRPMPGFEVKLLRPAPAFCIIEPLRLWRVARRCLLRPIPGKVGRISYINWIASWLICCPAGRLLRGGDASNAATEGPNTSNGN
jgi:hypothetical protein